MFHFILLRSTIGTVTEYGLRITKDGNAFRDYPLISADKTDVMRLLGRMEGCDLSPLHFDCVVRDFILELAFERMKQNQL